MTLTIGGKITIGPGINIASCPPSVAIGSSYSPYLYAYTWTDAGGFGAQAANPTVLPAGTALDVEFSPSGDAVVIAGGVAPYIEAWAWAGAFGAKYANPSTALTGAGGSISFTPAGDAIAVNGSTDGVNSVTVYAWNSATGFGAKYANPSVAPTSGGSIAFSPSGAALAICNPPQVYAWSSATGWGSRYTGLSGVSPYFHDLSWHPSGRAISFVSGTVSTQIYSNTYAWSDATGFGTEYTAPYWGLTSLGTMFCTFTLNGAALFVNTDVGGTVWASFDLTTGFGSVVSRSLPYSYPNFSLRKPAFTSNSTTVVIPNLSSYNNGLYALPWNISTGFGTRYTNPASMPATNYAAAFTVTP